MNFVISLLITKFSSRNFSIIVGVVTLCAHAHSDFNTHTYMIVNVKCSIAAKDGSESVRSLSETDFEHKEVILHGK